MVPNRAKHHIWKKVITHFVLGVGILILSAKSIVWRNLEKKKRNKMFDQLEGKFSEYKEKHPSCKLPYQLFNPERQKPRIIVIVLALMSRIHTEVCFLHLKVLPVMILSENKKE